MSNMKRWYAPAYESHDGRIVTFGDETVWLPGAIREAESLRSPDDMTEIFIAYRDVPAWQRLANGSER